MPIALLIPGLIFFGALVLVSLNQTLTVWSRSQTEGQASFWQTILGAVTGKAYVAAITKLVRAPVSRWALAQLAPVARWFAALNGVIVAHSEAVASAEEATAAAFERLRHVIIPRAVGKQVTPIKASVKTAQRTATHANTRAAHASTAVTTLRGQTVPRIRAHQHAIDVTLPRSIGDIRTREETLSRGQDKLRDRTKSLEDGAISTWKWLTEHKTSAAMGVFTGAVAWALSRLGYGFLRCRSWQQLGRSMKCSDANVLRDLLIGATAAAAFLSLEDLAKAEQAVVGELTTVVHDFWRA